MWQFVVSPPDTRTIKPMKLGVIKEGKLDFEVNL